MQLVEKHIISKQHSLFKECDRLCFLSKNLYNVALYSVRQHYFNEKTYLNFVDNYHVVRETVDYKSLPTKVATQTIRLVDQNFKSFFAANQSFKKNPKKFKGKPKLPKYKEKDGRCLTIYTNEAISKMYFKKFNKIKLSQCDVEFSTNIKNFKDICQVRIVPQNNQYVIEVVYEKQEIELKKEGKIAGIDLGLNNLATVSFDDLKNPFIINGRPLKSINQYYNKNKSKLQSKLTNSQKTSNKIKNLTNKRNNKINDYLHKASRVLVNQLVSQDTATLIIGKNENWKQEINIGKRNNQNFVQIPFNKFTQIIEYKCKLAGIKVLFTEESYTSKCSFLDNEPMCKHENYLGKRVKRGMFISSNNTKINADLNGSYNIIRKVFPKFNYDGTEGVSVHPIKLKVKF